MAEKRTVPESEWAKYGLSRPPTDSNTGRDVGGDESHPEDSVFAEQTRQNDVGGKPWWKANLFIKEPVLFGAWDGVFTSVMVNIFGVIVFLRMGWIVGQAGIAHAVLLLLLCAGVALVPVLSAIGICERCQIQSGGLYFLLSHILGARIGGAVGILYSFAQAVGTSLVAVGFGEAMAHLVTPGYGEVNIWLVRLFAMIVLAALAAVNLAGVIWVVKLQLALVGFLMLAVLDFAVGALFRYDPDNGVVGFNSTNFELNIVSNFKNETFFSVFGIFFSNFLGVLAGVNMSGDLKDPSNDIPLGELSAVGVSSSLCFLFIMLLGTTCQRHFLLVNTMIAERVSATRILLLGGVYISSLSSILGSMYGAPRVLQGIAAENVIPFIKPLEAGTGANKNPVFAMLAMTACSALFVLIGDLNMLAIISTIPFLITYAYVNYAYVSLAMTYDIQQQRQHRDAKAAGRPGYGSMGNIKGATDLDQLFPERQVLSGLGKKQKYF